MKSGNGALRSLMARQLSLHVYTCSLRKRGVDQSRDYVTLLSFVTTARAIIIILCPRGTRVQLNYTMYRRSLTTLRKWLMLNYEYKNNEKH